MSTGLQGALLSKVILLVGTVSSSNIAIATSRSAEAAATASHCARGEAACTVDASLLQMHSGGSRPFPLEASVRKYLKLLTKDRRLMANPRISCTEGNLLARNRIIKELKRLGAKPLGSKGRRSFVQMLPGTEGHPDCAPGIANVIGFVKGTEHPDDYILLSAHYNGPSYRNPVFPDVGNEDTDDSYDDAGGAAAVLAIGAQLAKSKPKTSVILCLTDAEEGWQNVGVQVQGADPANPQAFNTSDAIKELCEKLAPMLGPTCFAAPGIPRNYAIGMLYFAKNPTVPLGQIRLAFALDPLGAPGVRGSDLMAVLPYDRTEGLRDLLESSLPKGRDRTRAIYFPAPVVEQSARSYSDLSFLLNQSDMKQVPRVWIAQLGFQAYHGGMNYGLVKTVFNSAIPNIDTEAHWTLDRRCVLDIEALIKVTRTLADMLLAMAAQDLSGLKYQPFAGVSTQDFLDTNAGYEYFKAALQKGPSTTGVSTNLTATFEHIIDLQLADLQRCLAGQTVYCMGPLVSAVAVFIGLDFFSDRLGGLENFAEAPDLPILCPAKPPKAQEGSRWEGLQQLLCKTFEKVPH